MYGLTNLVRCTVERVERETCYCIVINKRVENSETVVETRKTDGRSNELELTVRGRMAG